MTLTGTGFSTATAVDFASAPGAVFVADSDDRLNTIETFDRLDEGILVQLQVTNAVRNFRGALLERELCTSTTVGPDSAPPVAGDVDALANAGWLRVP